MKAYQKSCVSLLAVAALGCTPLLAKAEPSSAEAQRLDTMVVSATRTEIPVFDAPQSASVLTSEAIMASPFERLEDIIRSMPGIYNFRHYSLQTNGIVSPLQMRGVGKNRVLVLVDGVPQNDNFNNAIAWVAWGHIPKETIDRIEIVRGPTSALYGTEGLGGVIHIITKKPAPERETSVRAEIGSAETYLASAYHSQTFADVGVMLAGSYDESDGFYMTEDPKPYEVERYRETGKLFGKATYAWGQDATLSLAALYFDQDAGQGREFFHNDLQLDQYWLNYSRTSESWGLKALAYLNRADKTAFQDSAANNFTAPFRDEKFDGTDTWGGDLQATVLQWQPAHVTFGASFKEATFSYDEDYPGSKRDAGAKGTQRFVSPFVNVDLRLLDEQLLVSLGGRYDLIETSDGENWDTAASAGKPAYRNSYDSNSEGSFSPKAGLAWHPDQNTTIRASAGKGFRAPSLFELYKVHVRGGGTYYREANPNLKPEEIWSYDIGAERFLTDTLWGRFTFYQSFASDYIGDRLLRTAKFAGGSKTRYEYQLDNIGEVDIYGIEAELEWYAMDRLTLFTNYTFNVSEVTKDENDARLEGNYLPNDPRHSIHAGIRYSNPDLVNVTLLANYYADIYFDNENTLKDDGYFTMDMSVSRRFFERYTVYLNVENIFDERYPLFRSPSSGDTIAPGLIINGGLKITF